jgi:hypothetical protein
VPDLADLARQASFVLLIVAPSALLGVFPLWLALRRRRPVAGLAALITCAVVAFVAMIAIGSLTFDLLAVIVYGCAAAFVASVGWSLLLLRTS